MEHATIGARIRHYRRARGVSAGELARLAGVTENAIRKIESGDSKEPRFSTGVRIARALKVEPRAIAEGTAESGKQKAPSLAAVLQVIRSQRDTLCSLGVQHAQIFGSVARGDANADSDVDVIIDPDPAVKFSLIDLATVREILQTALGRNVDVVTARGVEQSTFSQEVEEDSVSAF